jgi:hypothetical protein
VATITASELGVSSAPGYALQCTKCDQHADRRRQRAKQRGRAETTHPERKNSALTEDISKRSTEQDQRTERQQVGVGDPLLACEAAAEASLDRRKRNAHHAGVEVRNGGTKDRRDQRQSLVRVGHVATRVSTCRGAGRLARGRRSTGRFVWAHRM